MSDKKIETFIYEDLGFPIQLIDAPMQKIMGEWFLKVNLNKLQLQVLKLLIQQPTPLHAKELRFIRKYFEMTTTSFGDALGVTHAAVLKWEKGFLPAPSMDVCIRMFVMESLHEANAEFGKLFHKVSMASLAEAKKKRLTAKPLILNIRKSKLVLSSGIKNL